MEEDVNVENRLHLLLAEDDDNLGMLLMKFMRAKGFKIDLARDGVEALEMYNSSDYDFLILDVMMPEKDGFAVAKEVREIDNEIPILFLTAKAMKKDKLEGFSVGADDYLTKPFSMEELIARIEAILKRTKPKEKVNTVYKIGGFSFDPSKRVLEINGNSNKLTTKENHLLKLLTRNKNEILDRQAALRAIWGDDNYFNGRSMDVYIAKLRKILKEDEKIEIMNIHGKGFKLIDDEK